MLSPVTIASRRFISSVTLIWDEKSIKYRHAERPFDYAQGRLFDSAPARFVLPANVRCGRSAQDDEFGDGVHYNLRQAALSRRSLP
jgi:hypothetical protein